MIDALRDAGLLHKEVDSHSATAAPWFLKVLHAFSGWMASFFLLLTLGAMIGKLFQTPPMMFGGGLFLIVTAYLMLTNKNKTLFLEHVSLSASLAGQILITLALFQWLGHDSFHHPEPWFGLAVLELILMGIMSDYLHRVFSAGVFAFALLYSMHLLGAGAITVPLLLGAVVWLWLHEYADPQAIFTRQPISWGLSLTLLGSAASGHRVDPFWNATQHNTLGLDHPWIGALGSGMVLIYLVYVMTKEMELSQAYRVMTLIFVALLALVSAKMPGLSVAVTLLVVGFSRGNLLLMGLSITTLIWATGSFYYALHTTLLIKSALLVASGLLLLVLYAVFHHSTQREDS